jgi:nucleotide-binding universal stress UspA family protein
MKRLCVVVDGLNGLTNTQKSKIKRLSCIFDDLVFIINAYNPYFERYYFFDNDEFIPARKNYVNQLKDMENSLLIEFQNSEISIQIKEYRSKDLASYIHKLLEENEDSWLILTTGELTNRHTVHLEIIRTIEKPIIMLSSRGWPIKPIIAAAIDPVHQGDKDAEVDAQIVNNAQYISELLKGSLKIFHCRYVPRVLHDFANEIRTSHRDSVTQFESKIISSNRKVSVVSGNPEVAIPAYVNAKGVSLLVMGSLSRDSAERWFVGSTTETMLQKVPCDIFLANYRNK